MVTLYVAVVVRARNVRRVKIDEVYIAVRKIKYVRMHNVISTTVAENSSVKHFYLFQKMFFHRESEISPTIVITAEVSRNCEDAAGLAF